MDRFRVVSLTVSLLLAVAVSFLLLRAVSSLQTPAYDAALSMLRLGGHGFQASVSQVGADVPSFAEERAQDAELVSALRPLSLSYRAIASATRVTDRLRERLAAAQENARKFLASWSKQDPRLTYALLGDGGAILASNAAGLVEGELFDLSSPFRVSVVGDRIQAAASATVVVPSAKGPRPIGSLVVAQTIQELAPVPGVDTAVVKGERLLYGELPPLGSLGSQIVGRTTQWSKAEAIVGMLGIESSGFFFDAERSGTFVRTESASFDPSVRLLVFVDLVPLMSELIAIQWLVLFLMASVFVITAALVLLGGRQMTKGIEDLTGYLGRALQGASVAGQTPAESSMPTQLVPLSRLMGKAVAQLTTAKTPPTPTPFEHIPTPSVSESPLGSPFDFSKLGGLQESEEENENETLAPTPWNTSTEDVAAPITDLMDGFDPSRSMFDDVQAPPAPPQAQAELAPPPESPFQDQGEPALGEATLSADDVEAMPPQSGSATESLFQAIGDDSGGGLMSNDLFSEVEEAAANNGKLSHFREVFDEFVRVRQDCGEVTQDLNFDRFQQKLERSEEAVRAKHGCDSVRFSVYVKNGKAALKASPVRAS